MFVDPGTVTAIITSLSAMGTAVAGVVLYALQNARNARSQVAQVLDQLHENNLSLTKAADAIESCATQEAVAAVSQAVGRLAEAIRFVQRDLDEYLINRPRRRGV